VRPPIYRSSWAPLMALGALLSSGLGCQETKPTSGDAGLDGMVGSGGTIGSGGTLGAGGTVGTGGVLGAGGTIGTGGTTGTGGTIGTGGAIGTGGIIGTGGTTGTGGIIGTGGTTGTGGAGCADACTDGATLCLPGSSLQACVVGGDGCTTLTTATCSTGLACERYAPAACADPNWAEWPMPNSQADVTAGAPNLEAYRDNGDGTVTDNVTSLMWQQGFMTGYMQVAAAMYCQTTLALGGYHDWRLPSVMELVSLVDHGQVNPSINGALFPSTPASPFWSSSPLAGSPSMAWNVDFSAGLTSSLDATTAINVRCVR
jgi:hypothetical protein